MLAVIFFSPGLLPGHTTSASDYLWSAAPWNTSIPTGVFRYSAHPLIVGSNHQLVDPTTVFQPYLQYTRSQLPHTPLWNPYIMGGTPYLGDMQSAIFSPFSLPAYVLPFWWSLSVIGVMKVVVAAFGTFLFGTRPGHALRRSVPVRHRLRVRALPGGLAAVAAGQRVPVHPVDAAGN